MQQPVILAVSEPWGLYTTAAEVNLDGLNSSRVTLNQARDLVRRIPAETRPSVVPSMTELARRLQRAGVKQIPVAVYRLTRDGSPGRPAGRWHVFNYTAN